MSGVNEAKNAILAAMQPKEEEPSEAISEEPEAEVEAEDVAELDSTEEVESDEPIEGSEAEAAIDSGDVEAEPELYKVKIQGEEKEVSLEDLRSGYMMGADYTQKSQELAKQRDDFSKKQEELALKLEDAQYLLKMEIEDFDSEDMRELKEYDPERFYEKKELLEAKVKKFNELKEEATKHQQQQFEAQMKKEAELLVQAIPEWLDQEVAKRDAAVVENYWKSIGITENDMNNPAFQDHRFIKMSLEAAKYANMKQSDLKSKKVPPKAKTTKPASANDIQTAKSKAETDRMSRLKKTGKMGDAKAAIKDILYNKRK